MAEYQVHRIRFFNYKPSAINCLSYDNNHQKVALSRSDGSIEIWNVKEQWYQEQVLPPSDGCSIEGLVWCRGRLFSAGLHGNVHEHDLLSFTVKHTISANNGAVWCLTINQITNVIAAGTEDGCVVLFEVTDDGVEYYKSLDKQEGRILSIAWCEAENVIVTGGMDNIRIWSVNSGHAIQRLSPGRLDRNKETIVWSVAVANDFTIVSGDSRGKVCFWNGKQGTQITSIQSHKADVLSLCVSPDLDTVVASGVDPTLVQFEYIPVKPDSDWKMWIRSMVWSQHTHDVRAVIYAGENTIVSAGVDCQLICNDVNSKKSRVWKKFTPIPQEPLVYSAKERHIVLFRYPDYLELWSLGDTKAVSDKNGDILPLSNNPTKILQLKSKGEEYIASAAISLDAKWIAYCDKYKPKLFQLTIDDLDSSKISLHKVKYIPEEIESSRRMCFNHDGTKLLLVTREGCLQVVTVDAVEPTIQHTFSSPTESAEMVHLLSVSSNGKHVATGDSNSNIHIYDLEDLKHVCSLPKYSHQPTALSFHPTDDVLIVVYANQQICEYSIDKREYTDWSRTLSKAMHPHWLKRHSKISQIMYNPHNPKKVFLRDEQILCVIDKTKPLPDASTNIFPRSSLSKDNIKSQEVTHCFSICTRYKFLMHLDILPNKQLVVVERPPSAITEELPPTLKVKKFGT